MDVVHTDQSGVKLSIGVAVYNVGKYLDPCLESIFSQLPPGGAVEVLLTDDCSTDGSFERCRQAASRSEYVRVLQTPQNAGLSAVRNLCIENARGEWIAFVDGDDLLLPGAIQTALDCAELPYDVVMLQAVEFRDGEAPAPKPPSGVAVPLTAPEDLCGYAHSTLSGSDGFLWQRIPPDAPCRNGPLILPSTWGKLFRASFLRDNGLLFDLRLRRAQDCHHTLRYALKMRSFCFLDRPVYAYRLSGDGISQRFSEKTFGWMDQFLTCMWEVLEQEGLTEDETAVNGYYGRALYVLDRELFQSLVLPGCPWDRRERVAWLREVCARDWARECCRRYAALPPHVHGKFRSLAAFCVRHRLVGLLESLIRLRKSLKRKG